MSDAVSPASSLNLSERYREHTARLLDLIEEVSGMRAPRPSKALPFFSRLPDTEKERLIDLTELVIASAEQLLREGQSPMNAKLLSQAFLARAALHTTPEAYLTYREGDFVEVYLSNGQSIFSGLNIIVASAYTLEELQCRPWTELWHREESVTRKLMSIIADILQDAERKTVYMPVPVHQIFERETPAKRSIWIHNKTFSPVWTTDGGTIGFICINEARSKISGG